jgi:hypothetical protein
MAANVQWTSLFVAIVAGIGFGAIVGLGVHVLGVPSGMVGPITGAVVGSLIPLIYQLRTRKADRQE